MISFVNLLGHISLKMLFTMLLLVWSKKVNAAVMWWKNILAKNTINILKTLGNVGFMIIVMLKVMLK